VGLFVEYNFETAGVNLVYFRVILVGSYVTFGYMVVLMYHLPKAIKQIIFEKQTGNLRKIKDRAILAAEMNTSQENMSRSFLGLSSGSLKWNPTMSGDNLKESLIVSPHSSLTDAELAKVMHAQYDKFTTKKLTKAKAIKRWRTEEIPEIEAAMLEAHLWLKCLLEVEPNSDRLIQIELEHTLRMRERDGTNATTLTMTSGRHSLMSLPEDDTIREPFIPSEGKGV
jgi:hypothetical protein